MFIGGGINIPVNVTFKANKSQAKEIKCLLQQKEIQVILTSMDAEWQFNSVTRMWTLFWTIVQLVNV